MPDREIDQLSRVLGGIETELKTIVRTQSEDRMSAATYRTDMRRDFKEMHDDFNTVQSDVQGVQSDVRIVTEKVAEMYPTVVKLDQAAMMSKGAVNLVVVLGKFAHIISALIGGVVAVVLGKWLAK
jgi:hypothetical protein